MELVATRCPYCGSEGRLEKHDDLWYCVYCGNSCTVDGGERALNKIYSELSSQISGAIDEAIVRENENKYYNLRSLLWEKINAEYIDSEAIVSICRDIKRLDPTDFLACFFELANSATADEVADFISKISVDEQGVLVDLVVDFAIKSLTSKYIMPLAHLIERAYKNSDLAKFEKYTTLLETEAEKIEAGMYSTIAPRDVFVAYSSRDIDKVIELVDLLEENGLSCFVAMRNLQHGRDAVANYSAALRSAIDNSSTIVFVSSKNSRSFSCDALSEELKYIREKELSEAPAGFKNNYAKLPYTYKKPRIEYRLDNTPSPTDRFVSEFFADLDYCETPEKVLARIVDYALFESGPQEQVEEQGNAQATQRAAARPSGNAKPMRPSASPKSPSDHIADITERYKAIPSDSSIIKRIKEREHIKKLGKTALITLPLVPVSAIIFAIRYKKIKAALDAENSKFDMLRNEYMRLKASMTNLAQFKLTVSRPKQILPWPSEMKLRIGSKTYNLKKDSAISFSLRAGYYTLDISTLFGTKKVGINLTRDLSVISKANSFAGKPSVKIK